jgi:putative PIN family toxin of toxin-antitoxin system
MRLILDTNVVVSAFFGQGPPYYLLQTASKNLIQIFTSAELLNELERVLHRQKLVSRLTRAHRTVDEVVHQFRQISTSIAVSESYPQITRDPKDDMVLACAVAAKAEAIVSGDNDLLVLKHYQNIPVMRPAHVLQKIRFRSGVP